MNQCFRKHFIFCEVWHRCSLAVRELCVPAELLQSSGGSRQGGTLNSPRAAALHPQSGSCAGRRAGYVQLPLCSEQSCVTSRVSLFLWVALQYFQPL